jgi:predicted secreted protein
MAALSGTAGSVVYVTGGTTTVGEIKEWSLDGAMEPPEVTAFGDQWKEFIAGIREYSGTFIGNMDTADTVQTSLRNSYFGGSAVALRLHHSLAGYFSAGTVYITGFAPSISYDGAAQIEYSFQGSGALSLT